jgi:hypothetical protein
LQLGRDSVAVEYYTFAQSNLYNTVKQNTQNFARISTRIRNRNKKLHNLQINKNHTYHTIIYNMINNVNIRILKYVLNEKSIKQQTSYDIFIFQ